MGLYLVLMAEGYGQGSNALCKEIFSMTFPRLLHSRVMIFHEQMLYSQHLLKRFGKCELSKLMINFLTSAKEGTHLVKCRGKIRKIP